MSPFATAPGTRANVSQMDGERPSSEAAPSIWYDAVAAPQRKPGGKLTASVVAVAGRPTDRPTDGAVIL